MPEGQAGLQQALGRAGLTLDPAAPFQVVVAGDYLDPRLAQINAANHAAGRPWLLVRPIGLAVWIGPLVVPDRTACWECLAQRLRSQRDLEAMLARLGRLTPMPVARGALPGSAEQALQMAAVHAARFLASGGDGALENRVVTLDVTNLIVHHHAVVRRPQCPTCGDAELTSRAGRPVRLVGRAKRSYDDGGHRSHTPEQFIQANQHHISPVSGVVSQIAPSITDPDLPLKVYFADHNFALLDRIDSFIETGVRSNSSGKGMSHAQAQASALGEAIERYSGVYRFEEPRREATLAELGEGGLHPNRCMLFSAAQFRAREAWLARGERFQVVPHRFDPEARMEWSPVWSVQAQDFRYLPTAYLYYSYPVTDDRLYCWADSNGCSAGADLEEATLQGFLELVERDAVAIWWYNRLRRPGVDLDSFRQPYLDELQSYYAGIGREIWALDLTHDFGVPVYAALSRRIDHPVEDLVFAFGAHLDPKIALLRAFTEMNQFMPAVLLRDAEGNTVYTYKDRELLRWWQQERLEAHPFLQPADGAPSHAGTHANQATDDLKGDLDLLIGRAADRGMDTLILDQTRPDVGVPVVKVIVPGMRHFWARFGPGRLYDVPVELGWLNAPTPESELNPIAVFI
jgi:ribosomal protein S12 methylthiotransferase accessory factor